jgi:tRNA (cmo5U34)-methyltransferase
MPQHLDSKPPIAADEVNSLIAHYDEAARLAIPGYEVMHTMSLACLLAYLPERADLLVVGPGTGTELVRLGEANPQWNFLGVDPSADMLRIAEHKMALHQLSNRVKLVQGYTHDLPTDTLYDAATSIMVMHFIPESDKLQFLESISQRLHPSAPFVLVTLAVEKESQELKQLMPVLDAYWSEVGLPAQRKEEVVTGFNQTVHPLPEASILNLLEQAGFQKIIRFYTGLWVGGWLAFKS